MILKDHTQANTSTRTTNCRVPAVVVKNTLYFSLLSFFFLIYTVLPRTIREVNTRNLHDSALVLQAIERLILFHYIKHHEKRWAGRSTSWNQDCWEKYQ